LALKDVVMTKKDLLKSIEIGSRVAEQEEDGLTRYFVETDQWESIYTGKVDIVFGAKGTGKSALYTLLSLKENNLFDRGIVISPAENVRGETVFRSLVSDPPPSENSFIFLWKLYCLVLSARTLRDYDIENDHSRQLVKILEEISLLPKKASLATMFTSVKDYFGSLLNRKAGAVEHSITIDSDSGMPIITRRVEFKELNEASSLNEVPINELLEITNTAFKKQKLEFWILFDRLDVAFAESKELERNALRALVRCYNDFMAYSNIRLKIFIRDDIWKQIATGGFREASHVTRTTNIDWSPDGLLNLIMRRLISNDSFVEYCGVDRSELISNFTKQKDVMFSILPEKIDIGKNPNTFDWIVSRIRDGLDIAAPREFIHMFETLKTNQLQRLERGEKEPDGKIVFDKSIFKDSLITVSKVKYEQTLLSEYNEYLSYFEALRGKKSEHNLSTLSELWNTSTEEAAKIANNLTSIGFFIKKKEKDDISYWVPFIYRGALELVQGKAFSDSEGTVECDD